MDKIEKLFVTLFFVMQSSSAFEVVIDKKIILVISYLFFLMRIAHYIYQKNKLVISHSSIIIVIFCLLSTIWSYDFKATLIQSIVLIIETIIALYIANIYGIKNITKLFFVSGLVITIFSYIFVITFPMLGVVQHGDHYGLWKGIFTHKNNLGNIMAFYIMINYFYINVLNSRIKILLILFLTILQILLLIKSGSTTAFVLFIFITLLLLCLLILKKLENMYLKLSLFFVSISIINVSILIIFRNISSLINSFGKDLTFSGRTIIWDIASKLISENYAFGYGYKATFSEESYFYNYFISNSPYLLGSLHNGYLDILSYIGFTGFILVLISILIYLFRSIKLLNNGATLNYYPLIFLFYIFIINIVESAFLGSGNDVIWSLFIITQVFLVKQTNIKYLSKNI